MFGGFAPGSQEEECTGSIDAAIPFFEDYKMMLDEVKPDLAIVSPIFGITGQVIIECAKRKIDVFAEKPIASSIEELNAVYEAIKKNGIRFSAMHYLRFDPSFYHAAQMVQNGKIGQIKMITAQKSYRYGQRPKWYADSKLYGGTIPWVGIHAVDWISHFSGKRFLSVTARSVGRNPEMAALCQFQLEDQVIASVNVDYYRPEKAPSHGDDRIRCVGTEGVLEVASGKISLMNQEGCFEFFQFFFCGVAEGEKTVAIFLHAIRENPEVVIIALCHVAQSKFFFLRQVWCKFHIVGWTTVWHDEFHAWLEESLHRHDVVWKHCLVGCCVTEVLVLCEDVVYECGSATPVAENEERVVLQFFVGK